MKAKRGALFLALLAVLLFGGCAVGGASIPTPLPPRLIPTAVALTAQALKNSPSPTPLPQSSPTAPPTAARFPTQTTAQITPISTVALPTATPTPLLTSKTPKAEYAPVQILYPGADSRVLSPLKTRFAVIGRYTNELHVELLGEDGRLIYRRVMRLDEKQPAHELVFFSLEIPFELQAQAEIGRLQVSAWDEHHLPLFQNAVPLVLLKEGQQQINYQPAERNPILIEEPKNAQTVSGGKLEVKGKALYAASMVEVLVASTTGKVLIYRATPLGAPDADGYAPFDLSLDYRVKAPMWVRLVVRENSEKPEGVLYLNALNIRLAP